jgi:hypothetical protein
MNNLTSEIKGIDLPGVVRDAGVELQNRGGRWVGLCPFHSEKTPSFQIYQGKTGKWHYHCFGCGAHGDAVDFLQRLHGLDFKGALNHLGINQGFLTRANKRETAEANKKRQRRRELIGFFREWERAAVHHFSVMTRATRKALTELTPENFNQYGDILQPLSTWEYWLDILISGTDSEKFSLFQEHWKNEIKLIRRKSLFRPDFDYKRWLREKDGCRG